MNTDIEIEPWERLRSLATRGDAPGLESYVAEIGPSEAFRALLRLESAEREQVLITLSPSEAAELFEEIPDEHAADFIEELPVGQAASILSEMGSDERADVLGDMAAGDAEAILAAMAPEDAAEVRELIGYEEDEAGGLMVKEYLAFQESATVRDVIDALSERAEVEPGQEVHVYVVSPRNRLIGVIDLKDLVVSRRATALADLLKTSLFVSTATDLEEMDEFFDRHDFLAVPVVDAHHALVGVVRRDDVAQAIQERADSDYLKSQGILGGDEIRTLPLLTRSRRRLSWLSINIVLNVIAASVIAQYEDTLSAVIALAVFLPMVSDMSGCSGNQAVAVSMRELSLGIVKPYEVLRVWTQEITVGLINGVVLGVLIGIVAWVWKGNPVLGLVIGGALAANTLVAVSIGGSVPLLLKRIGVDPAVASGPILTTVTDICGFFLVLSFATLLLPMLTAA